MTTMKKFLKILEITVWVLLTGGLFTLLGFTTVEHNDTVCKSYIIRIDYGKADVLVTENDIYQVVRMTGNLLKGQHLGSIDFERIEREIRRHSYVSDAQAFMTLEGTVEIDVIQRQPILRIFNEKGESYYLDGRGNLLPLNPAFSARVLVASGSIPEPFSKRTCYLADSVKTKDSLEYRSVMNHLYLVAAYITKDKFLKAQIEQIYVEPNGEFELIPRIGDHTIILGGPDNLEEKFERLLVFYRQGLSKTGWHRYNIINIKFKDQVVCSKI
jgi:cell division protein FtsQ